MPTQRVSIVIAAKDAEMHIQETLESFGLLDHLREIIVVNDHSSDSTADIVEQFASQADVPVHLIHAEGSEPCGAARARNIGAKAATGDILWFFDADDICEVKTHDPRIRLIDQGFNVVAGKVRIFEDGSVPRRFGKPTHMPITSVIFIDRATFEAVGGFTESMKDFGEDLDLLIRIKEQGFRVRWIDDLIFSYRQHARSKTNSVDQSRALGLLATTRAMILRAQQHQGRASKE